MSRRTWQRLLLRGIAAALIVLATVADTGSAATKTLAPSRQRAGSVQFKLRHIAPADIRRATLIVGRQRLRLKLSVVRRAAGGVLKVKLPKAKRHAGARARKPRVRLLVLLVDRPATPVAPGPGPGPGGGGPPVDPFPSNGYPVVSAAGDIACDPAFPVYNNGFGTADECRHLYTAALLEGSDAVLALGDESYGYGNALEETYGATWGAYKAVTHPVAGDHEYDGAGFSNLTSYESYFGAAAGEAPGLYYSFDVGSWHFVALNSNCSQVSCDAGQAQEVWLRADLTAHSAAQCTVVYWHHPHFTDGPHVPDEDGSTGPFWAAAAELGADIVLHGNDHNYQRWPRRDATGAPAATGIREFVVGTGGKSHTTPTGAGAEVRDGNTFGVLKLRLHPDSYDWKFIPEAGGAFTDQGSDTCN